MRWTLLLIGLFMGSFIASAAPAAPAPAAPATPAPAALTAQTATPAPAALAAQTTTLEPAAEEEVPDAMKHLVKAPEIDFATLRDPFESYLAMVAARGRSIILDREHRLSNREREVLEGFDLASLKLVAIFSKGEDRVAMIQDSTGKGHIVRRGNYMGKDNGRIEKIDDDTVFLVEQVLNPAGDITDRQVTLTLKEVNQ